MEELPHWRVVMHPARWYGDPRIRAMGLEHAEAIVEMRAILHERGVVSNRDFEMASRTRTQSYRGRKDSALALYYLWRTGEVMTHHRDRFERVYALTETVAPVHLIHENNEDEADCFLVQKEIAFSGLSHISRTSNRFDAVSRMRRKEDARGNVGRWRHPQVKVEGWKAVHYALSSDEKVLHDLSAGRIPKAWSPLDTTTTEEVAFLAPLDHVIARGRAKVLFDFDYVWEVYKPVHLRKFGYYTLPILWGDRLVARFDSKLDRTTNTLAILGFWLEDKVLAGMRHLRRRWRAAWLASLHSWV